MASLDEEIDAKTQFLAHDLECPVCASRLTIEVKTKIKMGHAQNAGSSGFKKPVTSVHAEVKVVDAIINHECTVDHNHD